MTKKINILFTGGGTGGHLFPIIAIAREIKRLSDNPNIELHYLGSFDPPSLKLLMQEGFKTHSIISGKIRRYFSLENVVDIFCKIPLGFLQSFWFLLFNRPGIIFSKGGSGSAVVVYSAHILGIPIFIHESDTTPGLSNKLAYRWAKKVFISFPKTEYFDLNKAIVVGHPILKELMEGSSATAEEVFNLSLQKPVLLFWGGSQGAQIINDFVLNILEPLLKDYEIIHVCGKKNYQQVYQEAEVILTETSEIYYHLYEFLDEIQLKHALKVASLVISRAGSGSIFEIAACGKPSILIPLASSAHNHQSKNAYQYAATGAAIIIEQNNLNPNFFLSKINYLLNNTVELENMKREALRFSKPMAARSIAREILEYINVR